MVKHQSEVMPGKRFALLLHLEPEMVVMFVPAQTAEYSLSPSLLSCAKKTVSQVGQGPASTVTSFSRGSAKH